MDFLYLLETIRNPILDFFFSLITYLGDEPVFLTIGLFLFWCVDKYEGYYLMAVGFVGTAINQTLKIAFRIPRPWVLDEKFTIVESAKARAAGYSFPSGHTQFSVGAFGGIAKWEKHKIIRILCITVCILVPFSRMYLGVHTPWDVVVSIVCALLLLFGFYPLFQKVKTNETIMFIFLPIFAALLILGLIYMYTWHFPADIDMKNLLSGRKNLWTLLGSTIGIFFGYLLDVKYLHFETKATLLGQIVKVCLGIFVVLALKEGLKPLMTLLFGASPVKDCIRYGVVVFTACGLWPMTFRKLAKLGKKNCRT